MEEKELQKIKEWKMEDKKDQKALNTLITSYEFVVDENRKLKAVIKMLKTLLPKLRKEFKKQEEKVTEEKMFSPVSSKKVEDLYTRGLL